MITLEINHDPVPWKAHGGYGKKSYSLTSKEREFYRWQIRAQYTRSAPFSGPVRLVLSFHMPIPKATSAVRKRQMLNGVIHHIKRPDTTNLQKFAEDTLKGIVIEDDSQVVHIDARKIYSDRPRTVIMVEAMD